MSRRGGSSVFRRPDSDSEGDDDYSSRLVRAKPISDKFARKLGDSYGQGRDFVVGSAKSQADFYGKQHLITTRGETSENASAERALTTDEKNKLNAKILKAELKGDMDLVAKLKNKLASGVSAKEKHDNEAGPSSASGKKDVVLLNVDKRTGMVKPSGNHKSRSSGSSRTDDGKYRLGTVEAEYSRKRELSDMVAEEKRTTAEDQISMFGRSAKVASETRTEDDWIVDDNIMSHPKKRRHEEKDKRKEKDRMIKEHKELERTLDSCKRCIDSKQLLKHCVVATGFKTYLSAVPWRPMVPDHCLIIPMSHASCSVNLDEDVYEEMRIWRKGLVAMWREEDMDCVFLEMARNVKDQRHMIIECIPLPQEIGDMAPIYFKKAIMESGSEWATNKKLIDLSKVKNGDIRRAVPKGFSYFSVDFGLQSGYAHVIEDEESFPNNFAHEILGGVLDLDHKLWRKQENLDFDKQKKNCDDLKNKWADYDWTERAKQRREDS
ncbi:hypothetical protein QR680_015133 [Steinernema hermaphroditum]|uniref:Cwf19-like C-terminal domain-containing protein n=1 Tax=Steinernema hermaphroditum TaxID=289476 RepID=A0AA39IDH1_9BILA|nr:hypothetical protein QR680_015133 [Steinernema hermaphroditum]